MKLRWLMAAMLTLLPAMGQPGLGIRSEQVCPRPAIAPQKPEGRVAELIAQLASNFPEQRRAAIRSLIAMGPAIEPQVRWAWEREEPALTFPYLPVAANSNRFILDPRLLSPRHSLYGLEEVMSHLEEQRQLQASRITLRYTNAPLTNVLADLGRQANTEMRVGSTYWRSLDWIKTNRVTLDVNRANYWDALALIKHNAGLTELFENMNRPLLIQSLGPLPTPPPTNNSVVSGPLKITPFSTEVARFLNYGDGQTSAHVKLTLNALAEPKFWNAGANALVEVDECLDEQGRSLLAPGATTFPAVGQYPCYYSWTVPVEFAAPKPGGRIKSLHGRFRVELTTPQRYLSITNLMNVQGQSREFDGLAVVINKVVSNREYNEITLEVSAPTDSPYARTFTNSPDCCNLSVFDDSGESINVAPMHGPWVQAGVAIYDVFRGKSMIAAPQAGRQFNSIRQEAGRDIISLNLLFSKQLKSATLLWLTPPGTRWLTVPFEFHDLPLP